MTAPFPIDTRSDPAAIADRLIAWIDGVGAFLLCLGDSVSIGGLAGSADVRIAADLAPVHATIHRSGEGYVVEAAGPALVACDSAGSSRPGHSARRGSGRVVEGRTDLNNGDELLLYRDGRTGVRLKFQRPNVLTGTATLSLVSEHRTDPRYDSVILLADACVLGSGAESHIRCRDWEQRVLVFRRDGRLWCKSERPLVVGGREVKDTVPLAAGDSVSASEVSFRLESVSHG